MCEDPTISVSQYSSQNDYHTGFSWMVKWILSCSTVCDQVQLLVVSQSSDGWLEALPLILFGLAFSLMIPLFLSTCGFGFPCFHCHLFALAFLLSTSLVTIFWAALMAPLYDALFSVKIILVFFMYRVPQPLWCAICYKILIVLMGRISRTQTNN